MAVQYSPASQDAANLLGATIQKARKNFCTHSVISLREANCDPQVRAARASAPDQRVQSEESCTDCNSSIQEEIKALLTNRIIPEVEKFLCTGSGEILSFNGVLYSSPASCRSY